MEKNVPVARLQATSYYHWTHNKQIAHTSRLLFAKCNCYCKLHHNKLQCLLVNDHRNEPIVASQFSRSQHLNKQTNELRYRIGHTNRGHTRSLSKNSNDNWECASKWLIETFEANRSCVNSIHNLQIPTNKRIKTERKTKQNNTNKINSKLVKTQQI